MPIRIVKSPVMIHREGQFVYPPVGERFDFSADEVAAINKVDAKALQVIEVVDAKALQVIEVVDAVEVAEAKATKAAAKAG